MAACSDVAVQPIESEFGPFRVVFALGDVDRGREYRLRYEVFVEECHYESPTSSRLERDALDDGSCSLLLLDSMTGKAAACQRLVLPDRLPIGTPTNVEQHYRPIPGNLGIDFAAMPRSSWAELSRTTVAPTFRWGSATAAVPALVVVHYATVALAIAFGRTVLISLSEPATARLIRRLGFEMVRAGSVVDFHGRRAPFRMDVAEMTRSIPIADRHAFEALTRAASQLVGGRQ